nr:MAG TPA: hypothetical protein [Caudoviricetes sp.]DAJ18824.1 MAG TPA: hypothetical protein [Siphoviridae sp. ctoof1]
MSIATVLKIQGNKNKLFGLEVSVCQQERQENGKA